MTLSQIVSSFPSTQGSNTQNGLYSISNEDNNALICRFFEEVYTKKNLAVIEEFISPTHIERAATIPPGLPDDPEESRQIIAMMLAAFPDLHIIAEEMIAEGDKVVVRMTMHGTQRQAGEGFDNLPSLLNKAQKLDERVFMQG